MTGFTFIQKLRDMEQQCSDLGFQITKCRYYASYDSNDDVISLSPKDANSLPVYSRDAEVWVGSLEDLESFLEGVRWARTYDKLIRVSDEKRRERRESIVRTERMIRIIKTGESENA